MRILIVGGTGLTGTPLTDELAQAGHDVICASRGTRPVELPEGAIHVRVDVNDGIDTLLRLEPEVVIDMIAVREEHADRVGAFAGIARRAVVASSCDVYLAFGRLWRTEPGEPVPVPLREDAPLRTRLEPTGEEYNKVGLERRLATLDIAVTILRLPAVHGPRDSQGRLWPYLRRIADKRPIVLPENVARWHWTRGYCVNVAHAIALAATTDLAEGHTYNVGDEPIFTEREWVEEITRAIDASPEVIIVPDDALPHWRGLNLHQQYALDTTAIRSALGYREIVPVADGIRRTAAWQSANPPEADRLGDYDADTAAIRQLGR